MYSKKLSTLALVYEKQRGYTIEFWSQPYILKAKLSHFSNLGMSFGSTGRRMSFSVHFSLARVACTCFRFAGDLSLQQDVYRGVQTTRSTYCRCS